MGHDRRRAPFTSSRAAAVLALGLAVAALGHAARREVSRDDAPAPPAGRAPDAGVPAVVDARPDAGVPESDAARDLRLGRPMDVNRASASDLELLPRIGPALAARIVESRRTHGPFERPEDLARVRGIGPRTIERLRPFVRTSTLTRDAGTSAARRGAALEDADG